MRRVSVRVSISRAVIASIAVAAASAASAQSGWSTINSNFNGTSISAGNTIWFNSVLNLVGNPGATVKVYLRNSSVAFGSTNIAIPDADITFLPSGSVGQITFAGGTWTETASANLAGNVFLSGASYAAPSGGIPGGQNPVSWTGQFLSDTPGTSIQWQWAAAVYTQFSGNLALADVKPVDANNVAPWSNSDHAGTPEAYKSFVIGGARGGGGSNFTGSYSGTASVPTAPVPEPVSISVLGVGLVALARRKRSR
jgi:hypothetical protein